MEKSSAKILFYNENSDSIVASAGRISTTQGSAIEIYETSLEKDKSQNTNLIHKIISSGHTSVLEHVFLNLAFDNVSVFVEQFIIEFRLASFTVKSRRYVDFGNAGYVSPEFDRYGKNARHMEETYQKHMEVLFESYNSLLEQGIPKEDARFVLPYAFRSNFYCTVNAREFIKIVNEMVWGRGKEYPEIVSLGTSLIKQSEDKLPFLEFGYGLGSGKKFDIKAMLEKKPQTAETHQEEGLIALLNSTEHAEEAICKAALLEAGIEASSCEEIKDPRIQKQIIQDILFGSRKRELEQANFTILFRRISLAGITHLVRHRMQSIVIPKYIDTCDFGKYIMPPSIVEAGLQETYENVFRESGKVMTELRKEGLPRCDEIYLLLSGLTVPVMTTMNANELFTFIRLRTCNRAQWEIADDAKELLRLLREKHPILFSLYGPTCYVTGKCPEGRMSCGQMEQVKASFSVEK